jgi:hypothetical protein
VRWVFVLSYRIACGAGHDSKRKEKRFGRVNKQKLFDGPDQSIHSL